MMRFLGGRYIYDGWPKHGRATMERFTRATLFALYQLTLIAGIALLPLALVVRQVGFTLPVDRAVTRTKEAYEQACPA